MIANLIGVGYWGSFIYKTLKDTGFKTINLCDPKVPGACTNYKKMDQAEFVFVATPVSSHFKICEHFLSQGKRVFCEKPLTATAKEAEELYKIAEEHNTYLFVDWVFTYNYGVELIKQYVKDKENKGNPIAHAYMQRKNTRINHITDINAKLDLAGHDISVLLTLTDQIVMAVKWTEYRKDSKSPHTDSAIGNLKFGRFDAIVDVSWYNPYKARESVIKFTNDEYVIWNDANQTVAFQDNFRDKPLTISYAAHASPLERAIKQFLILNNTSYQKQKDLTLSILRILNNDSD